MRAMAWGVLGLMSVTLLSAAEPQNSTLDAMIRQMDDAPPQERKVLMRAIKKELHNERVQRRQNQIEKIRTRGMGQGRPHLRHPQGRPRR